MFSSTRVFARPATLLALSLVLIFASCDTEDRSPGEGEAIVRGLVDALNLHDEDAVVSLYRDDYRSEQPAHPDQSFEGTEPVRQTWSRFFETLPDFRAELLRSTEEGNEVWTEWEWSGTDSNDEAHLYRGVIIFGIEEGRIRWSRMYIEPVGGGEAGSL